CAQGTALPWVF
nr:immunoglobulin light chain junction region [Macaca mulatta]